MSRPRHDVCESAGGDKEAAMRMIEAMKMLTILVLLAASAMILMACNTVEGVGQDVRATGQAVERTANDAKPK
jgi:predicted small secreted protein